MKLDKTDIPYGNFEKVLLHICCAPDATYPFLYLRGRHYRVTGFFYNPNIHPLSEYEKRLEEIIRFSRVAGMDLEAGKYDKDNWFELIKGTENEPEGGKRCYICYKMRLEETARIAKEKGFDYFTTTLTISPHKNIKWIFEIGEQIGNKYGVKFLKANFKKRNGFKSSIVLSKYYKMYRQNYCGCVFSKIKKEIII
ncbi:MAG: epoxyqueuosine reductase QueH [Caldisericota bacterium]|nr:epoxyqueuosine reductase QueH [Caldisericota bacterium]